MDTYNWTDIYPISALNEEFKEAYLNNVAAEINALLGDDAWKVNGAKIKVVGKDISFDNGVYSLLDSAGKPIAVTSERLTIIKTVLAVQKLDANAQIEKTIKSTMVELEKYLPTDEDMPIIEDFVKSSGKVNDNGTFQGGFDGCVEHMEGQGKDSDSAQKLCAYIGRQAGKIKAASPISGDATKTPKGYKKPGTTNSNGIQPGEPADSLEESGEDDVKKKKPKKSPSGAKGETGSNPKDEAEDDAKETSVGSPTYSGDTGASGNSQNLKPKKSPSTASGETGSNPKTVSSDDPKKISSVKPNYGVKKSDSGLEWELEIPLYKIDGEKQLVGGVVYEPDTVDAQGDSASEEEIQRAAHNFMIDSKTVGIMHKEDAGPRAKIVESYIAPARMQVGNQFVKRGTWIMVVKIMDKELWDMVKSDKITGFSMGGRAVENPQDEGAAL